MEWEEVDGATPGSTWEAERVATPSMIQSHFKDKARLVLSLKRLDPISSPCRKSRTMLTTEEDPLHDAVWSRLTASPRPPELPITGVSGFKFPDNQNSQDWRQCRGLPKAALGDT